MSYTVATMGFEGPFDLLLRLVERQRIDIGAISLAQIVDDYTREVARLDSLDLDVASDFLLVASTLAAIKAAHLVQTNEELLVELDDEYEDMDVATMREMLVERLFAYKQCKSAAAMLHARQLQESQLHPRTAGPEPIFFEKTPNYLEGVTLHTLAVICADLDMRRERFLLDSEHIAPARISLDTRVDEVRSQIVRLKHTSLADLLRDDSSVQNKVVTFLALLELVKRHVITLQQDELFGCIDVRVVDDQEDKGQIEKSVLTSEGAADIGGMAFTDAPHSKMHPIETAKHRSFES